MADIYIRADSATGVVTFVHRRPFDPIHGLGETRDNLLKTGFFVDEFPEPQANLGKKATAYYDHERKVVYYEYEVVPFSEKEQLEIIQDMMNSILMNNNTNAANGISMMSMSPILESKEEDTKMNGLAKYLAYQILQGKLDKDKVLNSYPEESDMINEYLTEWDVIPTVDPEEDEE